MLRIYLKIAAADGATRCSTAENATVGELDRMIRRIALRDARRLVLQGYLPNEAAALATPGVWAAFRLDIVMQLCAEAKDEETEIGKPPEPRSGSRSVSSERNVPERSSRIYP